MLFLVDFHWFISFCKIGSHCITGIGSVIVKDVSPFVVCAGNPAKVHGINIKGLKRRGFGEDRILDIKRAYRVIFREGLEVKQPWLAFQNKPEIILILQCGLLFLRIPPGVLFVNLDPVATDRL